MKESFDLKKQWTMAFQGSDMPYPAESVIRIFKGSYPLLNLDKDYKDKKICDIGFGSGRNILLLKRLGFDVHGVEVAGELVEKIEGDIAYHGVDDADLRVGTNSNIPFEDESFDYLLSWSTCYYMGENDDFNGHVKEYARVLKKGGYLVLSVPMSTSYIYQGSEPYKDGYRIIRNDPFNIRNGSVLRMFESPEDIKEAFSPFFKNFIFSEDKDECFGRPIHLYMAVCRKKQ